MQNSERATLALGVAAAALFTSVMLSLGGCAYCQASANKDTKVCIAEREFTTCGPKAVGIVDQILPLLIAQDWSGALAIVATQAPDEYECIANVLDDKIAKGTYGPSHAALQQYRSARRLRAIASLGQFKIVGMDGKPVEK